MAKVIGPLFSLDARKSLGKTITVQGRPTGHSIMKPPRPSRKSLDNPSASQQTQRDNIASLVSQWINLPQVCKEYWNYSAELLGYQCSGYNFFMKKAGKPQVLMSKLLDRWPNLNQNLILHLTLDNDPALTLPDLSGYANTPNLYPFSLSTGPQPVTSKNMVSGRALSFNGITQSVDCGVKSWFDIGTGALSIHFLYKSSQKLDKRLFYHYLPGYSLWPRTDGKFRWLFYTDPTHMGSVFSSGVFTDGSWHQCVVIRTGSPQNLVKIYKDGAFDNQATDTSGNCTNPAKKLILNGSDAFTSLHDCQLDEIRMYNRALSVTEIKQLYDLYN